MFPNYHEPVFRPPSEAYSLILQVTLGCSRNRCTFCEMYSTKKFSVRPPKDVEADIDKAAQLYPETEKIFLADGDALVLSNKKLLPIVNQLYKKFPNLKRVTSYALPKNLLVKSVEELKELREAGLTMIYYGIESGDPLILKKVDKGATPEDMIVGIKKAHDAGLIVSTTNLLGLGGKKYSEQHAKNTASLLSKTKPKYISFLTVMFPLGEKRFRDAFGADYEPLNQKEILEELEMVVSNLDVTDSEFRSNHASNYLPLKGHLPENKNELLKWIRHAIKNPDSGLLRPEFMRGL